MQKRSRTEYSIINILTGLGGYVLNTILGFICRIVFVQCLSADYLGINGLFTNILTMLSLAELGVGSAIVYALYKPLAENDEDKIASLMKLYATAYRIIGTVIMLVGLALMPFLDVIIQEPPNISESIYLLYFLYVFNTASSYFFSYRTSLIVASQRNYIVGGINYVVTVLQSLVQMAYLLVFQDYLGYLLIQTAGTLVYNVLVSYVAVKLFPFICRRDVLPLPKEERRTLFINIRDLMIQKFSSLLVNSTDNILITFFGGLATTGITSNYTLLVNTLNSLLSQIFNGLTASIGNHNVSETKNKRYQMFCFLNMMNFWIYGWAALGIFFCSSDLVELCFGADYVLGMEVPFVMALNFFTVGMMNAVWTYKHTLGLFRYGRLMQMVTGILNIVFSVTLGTHWGLFGILIATTFARMLTNLWYDPYAVYIYGFGVNPLEYLKKYIKYILLLAVAAATCDLSFLLIKALPLVERAMGKIVLCSLVANSIFIAAFYRSPEFAMLREILGRIWQKIKRVK